MTVIAYAGCRNAQPREQLPPPIDIEELARRNGLSSKEALHLIRVAEWRGKAFSRIDSTGQLRWYWRDQE